MKFKIPTMADDFLRVHPDVQDLARLFESWSRDQGLPEPVVTDVIRTKSQQRAIYVPYAQELIADFEGGVPMQDNDRALAIKLMDLNDDGIAQWAEQRFSWHLVGCAVDLRSRDYTAPQLAAVLGWFRRMALPPTFEFLEHDVGRGDHMHLGRRDFAWRNSFKVT